MKRTGLTITVRNVPVRVVAGLKAMAQRRNQSMEQEVRDLLEEVVCDRESLLAQLEAGWQRQSRRPGRGEIDSWIATGRNSPVPRRKKPR
ncbi:MAG: hypothetical protein IT486_06240 [Gammaproteobacteria bacterium]|nr:hypothetical protein [Gammaproteobacteria bacterium]